MDFSFVLPVTHTTFHSKVDDGTLAQHVPFKTIKAGIELCT